MRFGDFDVAELAIIRREEPREVNIWKIGARLGLKVAIGWAAGPLEIAPEPKSWVIYAKEPVGEGLTQIKITLHPWTEPRVVGTASETIPAGTVVVQDAETGQLRRAR